MSAEGLVEMQHVIIFESHIKSKQHDYDEDLQLKKSVFFTRTEDAKRHDGTRYLAPGFVEFSLHESIMFKFLKNVI